MSKYPKVVIATGIVLAAIGLSTVATSAKNIVTENMFHQPETVRMHDNDNRLDEDTSHRQNKGRMSKGMRGSSRHNNKNNHHNDENIRHMRSRDMCH